MTRIAFVVNGGPDSAAAVRAKAFAQHLGSSWDVRFAHRGKRKILAIVGFFFFLLRARPDIAYVVDMAYSGVLAAAMYKFVSGSRLVIDTGDAIVELARSTGNRGPIGRALTRLLETISLRAADRIVVRGTFHREWLRSRGFDAEVIQDGVDAGSFASADPGDLRARLGLEGVVAVGVVGTSVWSDRLGTCYGWELVELVHKLADLPVKGVMIGDGSGIAKLEARARELGVAERMLFLGRIPYEDLPRHLKVIDVCLSTQSNDIVGRVRTTGKLPLYLAAGRYVLASRVGEASLVLDDEMLVEHDGAVDPRYAARLAERVRPLVADRARLDRAERQTAIARARFDYAVLTERLSRLLESIAPGAERARCARERP
jgi:glycosyltransferase involved in cell wall biosynthesis